MDIINVLDDYTPIVYLALILTIIVFAHTLLNISKNYQSDIDSSWKSLILYDYGEYHFFLAKASAYRKIFFFFTCISYVIKSLGILATFIIIYSLIDNGTLSRLLLFLSALFDSITILFPFPKYIDLFSKCSIQMEETIMQCDAKLRKAKVGPSHLDGNQSDCIIKTDSMDDDKANTVGIAATDTETHVEQYSEIMQDLDVDNTNLQQNSRKHDMLSDIEIMIYNDLVHTYIGCERLLHVENNI